MCGGDIDQGTDDRGMCSCTNVSPMGITCADFQSKRSLHTWRTILHASGAVKLQTKSSFASSLARPRSNRWQPQIGLVRHGLICLILVTEHVDSLCSPHLPWCMVRARYGHGSVYELVAEQRTWHSEIFVPFTSFCSNGSSLAVPR